MSPTRLQIARPDIFKALDASGARVFSKKDLERLLSENREFWRLAQSSTFKEFLNYLLNTRKLRAERFDFSYRPVTRYIWGEAADYEIIQSLDDGGYFTHFTAMTFHALTLQLPKTVYLNHEQQGKSVASGQLLQERIDMAFARPCRVSKNCTEFRGRRVCLVNGKQTGQLGVVDLALAGGEKVRTTDIERTLIDIAVRPIYAGGVGEVLDAYRAASDRVSVNKLCAMLKQLDYIYPYHQVIGFYMERSGAYNERQLSLLEKFAMNYDFYLTHQIGDKDYSVRWRLYYPKGL